MKVVIVGNGIAGVTAARGVRKRDPKASITMISGESQYHWSRPALMYLYMGHMRFEDTKPYEDGFWSKNRIDLIQGWVDKIDMSHQTVEVGERTIPYDALLLATGSLPNKFGWPGQDLAGVGGMYSLGDLNRLVEHSGNLKHGIVVGGGLIGIELAEMMHSRGAHVTMLVREPSYWNRVLPPEESAMVGDVIRAEGIDLRLETELAEIIDDGQGKVGGVKTSHDDTLPADFVGLTAGVRPNISLAEASGINTGRGILVDRTLRTSASNVLAAGDCAEIQTEDGQRNLIQAVWYTGRMQGEVAAANLLGGDVAYDAGIWFNSAKFFDLEYQVYGLVPTEFGAQGPQTVFWQSEDRRRAIRLVHEDGVLIGVNLMGIRYRHEVCEAWIRERKSIDWVIEHLPAANFDPEFFFRPEPELQSAWRSNRG